MQTSSFRLDNIQQILNIIHTHVYNTLINNYVKESTEIAKYSNKWTKTLYRDNWRGISNFWSTVKNIFSQKIISINIKYHIKNKLWTSYETLENSGEMKLIAKFYLCLHNFFELGNLFPPLPMGNYFSCCFRQIFISLSFSKCKKIDPFQKGIKDKCKWGV